MIVSTVHMKCPPFHDGYLIWPATPAGEEAEQHCPENAMLSPSGVARRKCHESGMWVNAVGEPVLNVSLSYTDFKNCMLEGVAPLVELMSEENREMIRQFCHYITIVSLVVLLISGVAVAIAIFILKKYRSLNNIRTQIHRQLFLSLLLQCIAKAVVLFVEVPQQSPQLNTTSRETVFSNVTDLTASTNSSLATSAKRNPAFVWALLYNVMICLWEYTETCVFCWMLVEGVHLNNMIVLTVFPTKHGLKPYLIFAWTLPAVLTVVWIIAMWRDPTVGRIWFNAAFSSQYWIFNVFRLCAFLVNMVFLCKVLRVVIVKLRANYSTEVSKVKQAVKGAILLLPLLGLTNVFYTIRPPFSHVGLFMSVSLLKYLLPASQGLFISVIYCFLQRDVLKCLHLSILHYRQRRAPHGSVIVHYITQKTENRVCIIGCDRVSPQLPRTAADELLTLRGPSAHEQTGIHKITSF